MPRLTQRRKKFGRRMLTIEGYSPGRRKGSRRKMDRRHILQDQINRRYNQ